MAGKCKYCGFVGTNDEMADHAGEMCHERDDEARVKIDCITECKYELVTVGNFDYRRYSSGTWTSTYADIEKEVEDETSTELEQAYQDFKQKGK